MARLDLGWNREDIDFDKDGRLVIKNPELAREIRNVLMRGAGKLELFAHLPPAQDELTQDKVTQDTATPCPDPECLEPDSLGPKLPPPPPNMCGCRVVDPRRPVDPLDVQPSLDAHPK